MKLVTNSGLILLTVLMMHVSCQKKFLCPDCDSNKSPTAIAGADQTIILPKDSVSLDGKSSTEPDGIITSYKWTAIAGLHLSLS